ncbi:MAG TPA: class I SAM-dependent methyltransferase [Pyrinomonadaceae bacterium]|jgi:SAM-dependent methyltransferase
MPTIEENLKCWNGSYGWSQAGDEWSASWGGAEAQWYGSIFPRIHAFVPAGRILEIAPGFGRWTQMLKTLCERLMVVDLSESCIAACKERFQDDTHISYYVNDGKSLEMIPDKSVDFAFTFDSLVHVEADVIEAYVTQLARKLTPHGVGFMHHSNFGAYVENPNEELPAYISKLNEGWRAKSMTAGRFKDFCSAVGLQCISQELICWGTTIHNDCFSLFTPRGSVWDRPNYVFVNHGFMNEASYLSRMMKLYSASSFGARNGGRGAPVEGNR